MHDLSVTLLLVGVAVVGTIPIAVLVAWLARRPGRDGAARAPGRALAVILALVTVLALGGGWYVLASSRERGIPAGGMAGMSSMPQPGQTPATRAPDLPKQLAGLPLATILTGEEALAQVSRLHGEEFSLTAAAIGHYAGSGSTAEVWVALAARPEDAARMAQKMADRIAQGGSPFQKPLAVPNRPGVWVTTGMGQSHYFFARGTAVWWLSMDPARAEQGLAQVLAAAS